MKKVFSSILEQLQGKKDVVLVTIIAGSGSTPRGAGARLWVSADGSFDGTIGGGNVEYQAMLKAKEVLKDKRSLVEGYHLGKEDVANIGMVCGGQVVVYFQYMAHREEQNHALCKRIITLCDGHEDAWLIMDITKGHVWDVGIYTKENGLEGIQVERMDELLKTRAIRVDMGDKLYYAEPLVKGGFVYVFGGGHVAREVVLVLSHLDFRCVVLDDRKQFVSREVFPTAEKLILCDFENVEACAPVTPNDYVIIMTRGHLHDYHVQTQLLKHNPCYLGVMGSRHKISFVTQKLEADGYTKEEIDKCHMPIGTSISAETPAEIAISVAGELIQIRANRKKEL